MDVKYINPFLSAIQEVFTTMVNLQVKLGKPFLKEDSVPLYEISSVIGLGGPIKGSVTLNMPKSVAFSLIEGLTGEAPEGEFDGDCADAIGEIANMITGNAKKDFPGEYVSISTPTMIIGRHQVMYPAGLPIISIPCDTSTGRLNLDVSFKKIGKEEENEDGQETESAEKEAAQAGA